MMYKFCKFCENRARDTPLRGVYIPHFGQIWVKISILGVLHPCRCTDGGEIWHGGGDRRSPPSHRCNVSPLRGEKPQNRPLSKLNTGRFALRAMLPVINMTYLLVVCLQYKLSIRVNKYCHFICIGLHCFCPPLMQAYATAAPLSSYQRCIVV